MPSTEADRALLETHGDELLDLAFRAMETRVKTGAQPTIDPDAHPEALRAPRATFVTLKLRENLRGCLGTVEAWRPLVADAADNAHRAAFDDDVSNKATDTTTINNIFTNIQQSNFW